MGIHRNVNAGTIILSQETYARKILETCGMANAHSTNTPCEQGPVHTKEEEVLSTEDTRFFFVFFFFFFAHFYFPASGQAVVTGVIPSPPRFLPSILIAHRVQQSHCSSIFHRTLLTHALALSASQFVHKKKSQRIDTSMHSAGLELTKLTYTRLEDNLIRHRGDRLRYSGLTRDLSCILAGAQDRILLMNLWYLREACQHQVRER